VGKTRLAREALAVAARRGALTRWAVATASARALPLGAFAATLGVLGPDPARLVRQASDALQAGAGKAGVVIGVDDAHLLDERSATLVHQLVLRRVLLTVESDLQPDPALLTAAARKTTELGDLVLAERIARAAIAVGGGFQPRLLLGNALHWAGRAEEAATELAELAALARTDAERAEVAIPRMFALAWLGPRRRGRGHGRGGDKCTPAAQLATCGLAMAGGGAG
jgi:hypothetical protein